MTARTVFIAALLAMIASVAAAQDEFYIREVVVEGGMTLTVDTVSYYLGLEAGDPLDREAIADGYRRLWDSGLFEDVRIEIEDHGDGELRSRASRGRPQRGGRRGRSRRSGRRGASSRPPARVAGRLGAGATPLP